MNKYRKTFLSITLLLLVISNLTTACSFPSSTTGRSDGFQSGFTKDNSQVMVTFQAKINQPVPLGDSIYISLLDEVTGLSINPQKYAMVAVDPLTYSLGLPLYPGEVVKYRYSREGAGVIPETAYDGSPVRYRLFHFDGAGNQEDIIGSWADIPYLLERGRITGLITDAVTGKPIPDILVSAGGEYAFSHADGSFMLVGLPPGTHKLVFYSIAGSYRIHQQGAVIAGGSTTTANVSLSPTSLVTVIFALEVPAGTPSSAQVRLAGNLYQLGNTFADLHGGVSTLASRMPVMGKLPDGRYMATLNLPIGAYIEYKYSLGDGFWSSELTPHGEYKLRRFIVPEVNLTINDKVDTWGKSGDPPIQFILNVPSNTPGEESISIQFNPGFGWTEPIPMQPSVGVQGETDWIFNLTGPFIDTQSLRYRYCRQELCGEADDKATMGAAPMGRTTNPGSGLLVIQDSVVEWSWLSDPHATAQVIDTQVNLRSSDFIAGISYRPAYHPSWSTKLDKSAVTIKYLNANWLILSPTRSAANAPLPTLKLIPSQDMLTVEIINAITTAQQQGFKVGIYPIPNLPTSADTWWENSTRDFAWWVAFFDSYTGFILHNASLASNSNASSLILGGDWMNPALPGGLLADGTSSNVSQDAEIRWRALIRQVRDRFSGSIAWAIPYPEGIINPPPFLDAIDQVFILWSAPLSANWDASFNEMQSNAELIISQEILPFQQKINKPIVIALSYPSISGAVVGCIPLLGGGCLDYDYLIPTNQDIAELELNLDIQATIYNAVLTAINNNDWISGFVSMGYYPPAILQDKSTSINGKPASGIVWYWAGKFLGSLK